MLVKALTTAVLLAATLAAPQAHAGAALSATIVIAPPPTIQVVSQGSHQRHWHKPAHRYRGFARHDKRHHAAHHQRPRHHAAPARRQSGQHHPGRTAQHHGRPGRH